MTPDHIIEKIREENAALRRIVHECANALPNGAYCSPECSLEFMSEVPREIGLVTAELKARAEAAEAEREALRKALAPFANASRIELVGIDGRRVYCTKAELYTARTLAGDNHE